MSEDQNSENNLAKDTPKEGAEEIKKQRDEYLAGWQRAKADFLNYRKEELMRFEEIAKYGNENLVRELITILDNFDLGLSALEKSGPVEKGIYIIRSQILDILKKRGLEKLDIKIGEEFNPSVAEAISEGESEKQPGIILEIIETGYKLHDKILRPARVKISKAINK